MALKVNQQNQINQSKQAVNNIVFGMPSRMAAFGTGGDFYEKLYQKLQEKVKSLVEQTKEKYELIKILKERPGFNYSSIVIALQKDDIVTAHIYLIEKTGEYPTPLVENIAGNRYEILRTPADGLDERYVNYVNQVVAETFNVNTNSVIIVDGTLVPSEFDVNNDSQVINLFSNGLSAIESEIAIQQNKYPGINIRNVIEANKSGKFFINLYFNDHTNVIYDANGLPIRQDICVSLSFKNSTQQNTKSINLGNDSIEILKVFGYIDFEFSNTIGINNVPLTQKFIPNFIITHIETTNWVPTPDIVLLAVASALSINEDYNYLQAFKPRPDKKGEIDYNDIGALNIEGNIENNIAGFGQKIKTKSKDFTMIEFNKAVQMLIRPNMMISIDIGKASPHTWFLSPFYHAKFNNSQGAKQRIINALNTLTNNVSNIVDLPIFTDITNKIHGGYYKTKDGIFDIRNVSNYLAVANFISETNQNPILISQYTNTLYNTAVPTDIRASERKKFIDNITNGSVIVKQFYDRVTFTSDFLVTLVNSLKSVGFTPIFSNIGINNDMFARRSIANFSNALLDPNVKLLSYNNMFGNFYMPFGYNRTF